MNCIDQVITDKYALYHGDCVDVLRGLPENSVGYSIFSPPFASLYTYSNSPRDLGNCRTTEDFFAHFEFAVAELFRVMKPGRVLSMHCMQLPTSKERDGYIGLRDFRGDLIRAFQKHGFIYHSEVVIWKDPVTSMQRTKALGLLHKTIRTDSSMSRQGIPDYLVTMRKPGVNDDKVRHIASETDREDGDSREVFPVEMWQRYASPVWVTTSGVDSEGFAVCTDDEIDGDDSSGIDPGNTLQHRSAREHDDERHICPLQLGVIRRGIKLWSAPGDVVLTPFMGIGSEVCEAIKHGRRAIGIELKTSYFAQSVSNASSSANEKQMDLFSSIGDAP